MKMRSRFYIGAVIFLYLLILFYLVFLQNQNLQSEAILSKKSVRKKYKLTIILREYEEFENNLEETVKDLLKLSEELSVVIIGDKYLYPPLGFKSPHLNIISLEPDLLTPLIKSRPEIVIDSDLILILPDSTTFSNFKDIILASEELTNTVHFNSLAIPVTSSQLMCKSLKFDVKKWTLVYSENGDQICDSVIGEHGILTKTDSFFLFSHPFTRPVFTSFYIQNVLQKSKIKICNQIKLKTIKKLFQDPHDKWKHKKYSESRQRDLFHDLGVKLVKYGEKREEWFGCSKETKRCFDTVINDMPEYLYQGRWTPPCCHKALKETFHHVVDVLTSCKARFWLEGGSLLGAARNADIIPWDYDIDIGIYKDDLERCEHFQSVLKNSFIDDDGFVWEKAIEGDFYRVQYSESNRLHVDIFPFYSKAGIMTKNTWMKTHRQDTEFPEKFLQPITKIRFLGRDSPAPNNVKEFLEFKFGKGVIENPKYPNLKDPVS